ncbi:uncharacterized protein EKO05_0002143 [Ascochyta rabiei]|uniref:ATP binding n=1 Tax=Didymella rabiei TaxID=5454 RepID=A0A163JEJ9_DIDRA|nr:uncharacterized protein EKO05_0002143 [Ascochyta rabiei]KZM26311.1 ATP binding [Ascochyta rabiei]UPX11543.1 hypothetical protein EKO05_0002143 [Ascochyta rabiei]
MSSKDRSSRVRDPQRAVVTTTCFIANLHCPSCVGSIQESLNALYPAPESIVISIVAHSVVVRHKPELSIAEILGSLDATGFEVHCIFQDDEAIYEARQGSSTYGHGFDWPSRLERAVSRWATPKAVESREENMRKNTVHLEQCDQCKAEQGGIVLALDQDSTSNAKTLATVATSSEPSLDITLSSQSRPPTRQAPVSADLTSRPSTYKATLALSGMTCSSCVSSITHALEQLAWVRTVNINLLTNSGVVTFEGKHNVGEITGTIEDCGFDSSVDKLEEIETVVLKGSSPNKQRSDKWRAVYTIREMTHDSCASHVTLALKSHSWIDAVDTNLLTSSATVTFRGKEHLMDIKESIEGVGYAATLEGVNSASAEESATTRAVSIRIDGMFCAHCPDTIIRNIRESFKGSHTVDIKGTPLSLVSPILYVEYLPDPPIFSIRHIFDAITRTNPAFVPSIFHPPSVEERANAMHTVERRRTMRHLVVCAILAIPTFILGVVFMSLVPADSPVRQYIMVPALAGNATRLSWALFFLAIPAYFYSAKSFHIRAFKELKAMWRPGSHTPMWHRFTRFGSMNMLISLGTTIAFFASIAELALAATKRSSGTMDNSYFDAVVFLTLFLLVGRFLEAFSKAKTGDAVTSLRGLRPNEATLVVPETGDVKMATDLLEVEDVVRVHYGTSPPFDGVVLDGNTNFDESSLTGESRPVKKAAGDNVYSGTVNRGAPIKMKITTLSGASMLDQIINAVREGQTHRAPVERVADTITAHFAPCVVAIAIVTWLVWLVLGTTGAIPKNWRDEEAGGWALWSLRFAIAVFVIACPCGIGLAAPTALFVGGGLAAKHGILVRGGGEAFQEASSLDCIVFDKTGTLTQGGDPTVTDHAFANSQDPLHVLGIVKALEENSGHPIAQALVSFCSRGDVYTPTITTVSETPGKGLKGTFNVNGQSVTAIIGNEAHIADHNVFIPPDMMIALHSWKARGESVALLAVLSAATQDSWQLACIFSISDALRPEATGVVRSLRKRGIDVWMLSGDNVTTANAVGAQIGIPGSNIIAGVLPDEKAEKIEYLRQTLTKPPRSTLFRVPFLSQRTRTPKRATIAMVGDGINDAPALSTADLSIAIGSGSDIALSSSSFILINSDLTTILTLLDLSRVVFRRVYFNFGWALVYNLAAMPIAAGALYPVTTGAKVDHHGVRSGGKHIRLDPVWASLAMALSSLSVVCSSLALRSRIPGVGFKARKEDVVVDDAGCGDDAGYGDDVERLV